MLAQHIFTQSTQSISNLRFRIGQRTINLAQGRNTHYDDEEFTLDF